MEPRHPEAPVRENDIEPTSAIQLTIPAEAENVAVVRHALAGLAAALEMDGDGVADLKTVVTEACMNVVVHAYEDGGPLEVRAWADSDRLTVSVRDYGLGVRPVAAPDRISLRLGLALIAALSQSFSISSQPGEGTEVTMELPLVSRRPAGTSPAVEAIDHTRVRIPAGEMMAPILSRVIGMYAARADFSVDRLSDAILLSDAISYGDPDEFPDSVAQVEISESDAAFSVRVGPLRGGGGDRLRERMRIPELGASLEGLADEVGVESDESGDFLLLRITRSG
ncbi:MAG TPA: ATP-binding protein [Solirubrobacterales bacterium]|nr:ATP-binding protein [Solirubrobacterales bacterium]